MAAKEITGKTRVWAHLAHPSTHIRATQTFNRAFRERELDVVAVSIDVTPADMPSLVRALKGWRNLCGMGVTMPHKGPIANVCDETVDLATLCKSVNTIRREPDGRLIGTNTDGAGFLAGLKQGGHDPAGKRVLLVGIGGAGKAIAFALAQVGTRELTLANRTRATAEEVAVQVAQAFPKTKTSVGPPDPTGFDIVVNATPLGMQDGDALPLDVSKLTPEILVVEIIATRERTRLVEEAERRGCQVHLGLPMLTSQIDLVIRFLGLEEPPRGN